MNKIELIKGDCLENSKYIEDGSIDLILTDLPYGTIKNIGDSENITHGMKNKTLWDYPIEPKKVFEIANRILRKNGKIVFFSQEPYTTKLINDAIQNISFLYRMIWEKDHFANSLIAKKAPVSYYEDILIFSKDYDIESIHPLRSYFKLIMDYIGLNLKQINAKLGHRKAEHTFYINSTQYNLCTEQTYNELIEMFKLKEMQGFKTYSELRLIDEKYDSIFNLWEGKKFKSNILKYKKDYTGFHPTQKPILLLEDLIKTFSNDNNLVSDLTFGSCSTGVACMNTNRNFIGIEKDDKYFDLSVDRVKRNLKDNYELILR